MLGGAFRAGAFFGGGTKESEKGMTDHRLLSHTLLEFGDFVSTSSPMREKAEMQLFFAEWCGHCRRFKPM